MKNITITMDLKVTDDFRKDQVEELKTAIDNGSWVKEYMDDYESEGLIAMSMNFKEEEV